MKLLRFLWLIICDFFEIIKAFKWHYSYAGVNKELRYNRKDKQRQLLFKTFLARFSSPDCRVLQISLAEGKKLAPHFDILDLYDPSPLVTWHIDVCNMPEIKEETYDAVICNAVLEHVTEPQHAVKELYRVLKQDGEIWIEVPFIQPYHPAPEDYWRVTEKGIKLWCLQFKHIDCGYFGSPLFNGVYFWGKKEC